MYKGSQNLHIQLVYHIGRNPQFYSGLKLWSQECHLYHQFRDIRSTILVLEKLTHMQLVYHKKEKSGVKVATIFTNKLFFT